MSENSDSGKTRRWLAYVFFNPGGMTREEWNEYDQAQQSVKNGEL